MKTQRLITSTVIALLLVSSVTATIAAEEKDKVTSETPPNAKAVAGDYYRGDGLGYNISLTLKEDGKYTAEWHGCLGKYGEAVGTWKLKDRRITFTPSKEEDMMQGHLRSLDVLKFKGDWILVPAEERDRVCHGNSGVGRCWCFQKIDKSK